MRTLGVALALAMLPGLAAAGAEMLTWTDASGIVHYSNIPEFAPDDATPVESRITVEVDHIPPGVQAAAPTASEADAYDPFPADRRGKFPVTDLDQYDRLPYHRGSQMARRAGRGGVHDSFGDFLGGSAYPDARSFEPLPDAPRVYDEARLKFGCYTAGVLSAGGFSHPNDISGAFNCYPYRLGPQAWLNAAKAELAMRENGINPRNMMKLYMEEHAR